MNNPEYNSLTEKLIQNGILPSSEDSIIQHENKKEDIELNYNMATSPFLIKNKKEKVKPPKKRLNQYDLELINDNKKESSKGYCAVTLKRFLEFKHKMLEKGSCNFYEKILYEFFPKLYRVKIAQEAIKKLLELNIDTKKLFDKAIPYGESENRYEDIIKYINYANELQIKLNKKI